MLKTGVLDPQGEAVRHALTAMGFEGVNGVRQGKVIELDLADGSTEQTVTQMCEKLLANTGWKCSDACSGCGVSRIKL